MKKYLMILLVSTLSFSIETKEVLNQLTQIHGTNWKSIIKTDADIKSIRQVLSDVIYKKISLSDYGYKQSLNQIIRENAIGEFGHFVTVDSSGNLRPEDAEIFNQLSTTIANDLSSSEALSLYYSLKNAGTPETLTHLNSFLSQSDDLSVVHTIAQNIKQTLNGVKPAKVDKGLDFSHIEHFAPRISTSYKERKGNWDKAYQQSLEELSAAQEMVSQKSNDPSFIEGFKSIGKSVLNLNKVAIVKEQVMMERNIASNSLKVKVNDIDDRDFREIASKESEKAISQTNIIMGFIMMLVLFFFTRKVITKIF